MNKRFSTLLATVLVAGGLSANAQITGNLPDELVSKPARNYVLVPTTAFVSGNLSTVLATETAATGEVWVKTLTASATDVNNQLWTIEVETVDGSNRFVLKNKATGLTLSYDASKAIAADDNGNLTALPAAAIANKACDLKEASDDTKWTWYSAPNAASATYQAVEELSCAISKDSTMGLFIYSNYLYAYKYQNDKKTDFKWFFYSGFTSSC